MRYDFAHEAWQSFVAKLCDGGSARAGRRCRLARKLAPVHREFERKMSEDVAHYASHFPPCHAFLRSTEPRRLRERLAVVKVRRPGGGRHLGHATQKPARRASAQQHAIISAAREKSGAAAQLGFAFRRTVRKQLGLAARMRGTAR